MLSHIVAVPDIVAGRLIPVMNDFQPTRLPIYVVYPSRRNIPLRVKAVLDFLTDAIGQDPSMCASSAGLAVGGMTVGGRLIVHGGSCSGFGAGRICRHWPCLASFRLA